VSALAIAALSLSGAGEIAFERVTLSTEFTCEGATFADLDRDGANDVIAGPYWYAGPDWKTRRQLYQPKTFDPHGYSDNFFAWPRDFDGDGWLDVLVVGFPGAEAFWLRNPLGDAARKDAGWERFLVHAAVDNESPAFTDLTGDGEPELVFHTGGRFGWAEPDAQDPRAPWRFRALSPDMKVGRFTHGLGVGDVDGDGKKDVLWNQGWFQQPQSLASDPEWLFHAFRFSEREGGAQIFAYDVDGDGDGDVITSLAAHHYGLSWFESVREKGELTFREHRFMDDEPADNAQATCVGELHALDLADVNRDGLLDVVTGKRWWSHGPESDTQPVGAAPLVWFELVRKQQKVEFVAHEIDDQSGVGTQLVTGDVDGDGKRDVVVASKRGAFVLLQREKPKRGAKSGGPTLDFESGDLRGWTATGDAFALQPVRGDTVKARGREPSLHEGEFWIGGYERLGDGPKGTLTSDPFEVTEPWASFLVGGGAHYETRVEIWLEKGELRIFRTWAANHESLQRVVLDLRPYVGKRIYVKLVDDRSDGWGHVNFDDFRFHSEKPSFELPPGVPLVLPFDDSENAGLSPQAAAKAMSVPPGFRVDLIAAEPDVHQPIALAIDDRGRLWVAEAFEYPVRAPGDRGRDDILVFEDADHDGTFETRTVFATGLNLVSGLEVGFGGVWVGAAPYLMFIPDRDGDLRPDAAPEILLDGWGWHDTHETLNALTWGPDGWLYGCHGVFTTSRVGKPGTPDDRRTPIDAGVWRYHPTRREFEVFAWGTSNPWGIDFDENGQAFITACVIPHLYHVVQGGRYERQAGSHYDKYAFDDIKTIADHRHWIGDSPHGGNLRSNSAGGGHAHCGLLIYQGDQWPSEYRGGLYFENIHGNRINRDVVERKGSGFVGKHADDLLVANDRWFRGIAFEQGPDGSMYFIDWYDQQACHLATPEVWDRTNGRIYRLSYGKPEPVAVDLQDLSSPELAELAVNGSEWHSRHARRLLQERGGDPSLARRLREVFRETNDGVAAVRALWTLHAIGATDESTLRHRMSDGEYIRAWATQLAAEDRSIERDTLESFEHNALFESSPIGRLYLASALQRLPLEDRWTIAFLLAGRAKDESDPNLPLMIWYAIEPLVAADADRALARLGEVKIERVARLMVRRAAAEPRLHASLVRALGDPKNFGSLGWMLEEAARALEDQRNLAMPAGWAETYPKFAFASDSKVHQFAHDVALAFGDPTMLPKLRATLADRTAAADVRVDALAALVRTKDAATAPLLRDLVRETPPLRGAAIRALAEFDDADAARAVLASYSTLAVDERRDAVSTLSSRASYAALLLDAVDSGAIARTDLGAFVVRKLENLGDAAIVERLRRSWGQLRDTPEEKARRIAELKASLSEAELARADVPRGREVFSRTCQQCHTLYGVGGKVGPDLTGSNRADLDYLLSNVVDPNAVVGKDYLATMIWTVDGLLVTGILRASTDSSITLATENEEIVVAKDEIETERLSDISTMPEGLLETLQADEIRDLVAYLRSPTQTPILATAWSLDRFFNGRDLAGWSGDGVSWSVEDGEIVGRTSGLARNEFLVSELELTDFRLSFDVRLAGDQGNSGIQFRSRLRDDGEVEGYQADVGAGWWGALYEEHGRGLLSPAHDDARVLRDGWNRYEIEAKGHRVRTWINGQPCVDLDDPDGALRGFVALQIHSGGPTEVRFRNLRIE
jgi:putative membrane-bound dehydrogenase-like protein